MTIFEAFRQAKTIRAYFSCANGASIIVTLTKTQVREICQGARLDRVFANDIEDGDTTATWDFSDDTLHLHFAT